MKKTLPAFLRSLICVAALLLLHISSYASHIVGGDLKYIWVSGNTYKVEVILYGNCGSASSASFSTLQISTPEVCVWNGGTYYSTVICTINAPSCGTTITPVCPADSALTQCTIETSTIPGITMFVYTGTITLPSASRDWRFVYTGDNGGTAHALGCGFSGTSTPAAAGRAASITNITAGSLGEIQLIDTLNNADTGIFSHNTNVDLTVIPTPFFCLNNTDCYNPGAVDPDGDSLRFALVPPTQGSDGGGSAAACAVGGACTYIAGASGAWTGQPLTAATPLQDVSAPPAYNFDPATGQICFYPMVAQRSIVVYNIEEFRNDTMVGTCQREMTFVVLTCPNSSPVSGTQSLSGLDSVVGSQQRNFYACGDSGSFCVSLTGTETDTSNLITMSVTGLQTSMTYTVTNNGTNHPVLTVCGNTDSLSPGLYDFFVHLQDNSCPLVGSNTIAYSIYLYPVPAFTFNVLSPANCFHGEIVQIVPGGTGKPWTVDVSGGGGLDTFQTYIDSLTFLDTLNPNGTLAVNDTISVFTSVSHYCYDTFTLTVQPPPPIDPRAVVDSAAYCGGMGKIILEGLYPNYTDTVKYQYQGVWQTNIVSTVTPDSTITITGLAGVYDSIIVTYGFCHSQYLGPDTIYNPPFPIRAISALDPTNCGNKDGSITLYGLNPNQLDTIYYYAVGVGYTSIPYFVGLDSTVIIPSLGAGSYANFYARTDSVCVTDSTLGISLVAPTYSVTFTSAIHYGCHGDTVDFTSVNTSAVDTNDVTYHWYFGDGYTDTATNPIHIYANTESDTTFIVKQYAISEWGCIDSTFLTLNLVNYIAGSYSITPYPYVCQSVPVNFTNTSVSLGTGPNNVATTYQWSFGDGNTSNLTSPTNTYINTGNYTITMIQTNFVPCSDTVTESITVDTISGIALVVTDTTLCSGQQIQFTALYADEGHVNTLWSISDGFAMDGVNPILHSFDGAGVYTVSVSSTYRACPETSTSRVITVFPYASLYLGPDTAICPGSNSITLSDTRNEGTPGASWLWNTGETGSQITVTKPGYYYVTVTINGCGTSDTINVGNDCYMDVPNAFTPNGDGVNDYFFPRQLLTKGMTSFNMNIYNRWGQLIYQTTNIDGRGWDGNFNGQQQPEGVYVYVIDVTFQDGENEHHQGNVTLLR